MEIPAPIAPLFGGKVNHETYYVAVSSIVSKLRPTSSLRTIANCLNQSGYKTPTGLIFTRDRVATYIKNNPIQITKE